LVHSIAETREILPKKHNNQTKTFQIIRVQNALIKNPREATTLKNDAGANQTKKQAD
jgi:hypothetical protein